MTKRMWVLVALLTVGLAVPAAGVSKTTGGTLNMIAWEGYTQAQWVKPFEKQSGCTIHAKYAGSSDEMVALMRSGGGSQYDMVSASGDASLRLIYGGDVQPVDPSKIPDFKNFGKAFQSPPNNTVKGKHYGISLQWGPNTLLYNTQKVKPAPTSWASIYSPKYKGLVTVPDNPIQIADAALYLMKTQPKLGITDPYELNQDQFNATINLLKQQKPLIKKYWALASDEIDLFKNGDAVIGASWPYQTNTLIAAKAPVKDLVPKEGATGWLDTWMVSSHTKNLDCAYKWLAYISTPKVQAEQAIYFGETPVNTLACAWMNKLSKGSCAQYHANAPLAYFKKIYFWKTPISDCGNGKNGLHAVHGLAAGLDAAQGVAVDVEENALAKRRRRAALGSGFAYRHRQLAAFGELTPALACFLFIYIAALVVLFISAFWTVNEFTGEMEHVWTTSNFSTIFHSSAYRTIALRTIGIAAAVTVADALLAFPFAYYMARMASRRRRSFLFVAVLLPLWSSYLLRVYAWRLILNHDGLLNWTLGKVGLPDANIAYTNVAVWIVFTYIWLPFMIIPIYGALERIPNSTIEASLDLGAKGGRTFRSVILPLALPGVVAGSIFTFALTLGDYVTPTLVGGTNSEFIGNVVYESVGVSNNIPFAAAYATIPLVVMGIYLVIAKRLGAFEAL